MRALVVYYSFSGITRKLAENAARVLEADVSEVCAERYESGSLRYLRAALDSWRGRQPEIEPSGHLPEEYDLVLVMAPVWVGHAATPIRAYLARNRGKLARAAFVLTCGGSCPPRAFEEMAALAGVRPEATITLTDPDIKAASGLPAALAALVRSVKLSAAA